MKKDRADKKREKKEQKKLEKEAKKALKEKKKAEKQKEMEAKKAAGPKKRGRKASEKSKERKGKSLKESNVSEKDSANLGDNQQDQPDQATAFSSAEASPVRSRQMKRLKKMSKRPSVEEISMADEPSSSVKKVGRKKPSTFEEKPTSDEKDLGQEKAGENEVAGGNVGEPQLVQKVGKEEKAPEIEKELDDNDKTKKKTAAKSKPKAKAQQHKTAVEPGQTADEKGTKKARGKARKAKTSKKPDDEEKKPASRKRPGKKDDQVGDEEKPKKTRSIRKAVVTEVDESMKGRVAEVLSECNRTHCTHPTWKKPKHQFCDLQPYATRKACGVKVDRKFFVGSKAKGTGKAHVTYFSCKSPCLYTNMALGELWVSRLQCTYKIWSPDLSFEQLYIYIYYIYI